MRMMRASELASKEAVTCFGGVVGVAVEDGVDGGLAYRHGDVGGGVFVEAGAGGEVFGGLLDLVDAGEGRGRA